MYTFTSDLTPKLGRWLNRCPGYLSLRRELAGALSRITYNFEDALDFARHLLAAESRPGHVIIDGSRGIKLGPEIISTKLPASITEVRCCCGI